MKTIFEKYRDDVQAFGKEICNFVQDYADKVDKESCDICPWSEYCSIGHNGVVEWLKRKEKCDES